jgi:hypothetical protein
VYIGANQKGMSAGAELTGWRRKGVELVWSGLRYPNLAGAWVMEKLGAHKQIANRVLEPWVWTVQIFSATELDNFFLLRDHPMAEPHFHELARQMRSQYDTARVVFEHVQHSNWMGKYQVLQPGEWHLPLVGPWSQFQRSSLKQWKT